MTSTQCASRGLPGDLDKPAAQHAYPRGVAPPNSRDRPPRSYAPDGSWPHGLVDAPLPVIYCAAIAINLEAALAKRRLSLRAAAALTGVDRQTITRTRNGETVPDLGTIACLEAGLCVPLWPHDTPKA